MRYAVIITDEGCWDIETDDLDEAQRRYDTHKKDGVKCVLVEVLANTETTVPDLFANF